MWLAGNSQVKLTWTDKIHNINIAKNSMHISTLKYWNANCILINIGLQIYTIFIYAVYINIYPNDIVFKYISEIILIIIIIIRINDIK